MTPKTGSTLTSTRSGQIKYIISYSEDGWRARLTEDSMNMLLYLVGDKPPDEQFMDAMDACCDTFYPYISKDGRPWHEHNNHNDRKVLLEGKALDPWPLDWYWKALVTYLPLWLQTKRAPKEISITLSQIRKWMFLSVHRTTNRGKTLLRAPMFGRSTRIADWDQYWLYLLKQQDIVEAWKKLKSNATDNTRDRLEPAYIVGRHDVVYRISREQVKTTGDEIEVSISAELNLSADEVKSDLVGMDIPIPHDLVEIPTFANGGEVGGKPERTIKLLLASDSVCRVLEDLSAVWNDPTIKSIHINAPPGSGKEVLAQTVYWFQKRPGHLAFAIWSPHSPERNQEMLFGMASRPRVGLVSHAENGCLVLDEIDKADGPTRGSLLRLLESRQYVVPGTSDIKQIDKDNVPLYLCLSSKPVNEVLSMPPPDFWTRVQLMIEMSHPLSTNDEDERVRILAQYFHLFWKNHVEKLFNVIHAKCDRVAPVKKYYDNILRLFLTRDFPQKVAVTFAISASTRYKDMSVRNIRTIAERCVFNFVQEFIYSKTSGVINPEQKAMHKTFERLLFTGAFDELIRNSDILRHIERIVEYSMGGRVSYPG